MSMSTRTPLEPSPSRTPLPKLQLSIALFLQATEPLSASVISPFINQFVQESGITGGDERKVGYYAGVVGSLFFFSECLVVLFWGRLSDRIGRKPVLLVGTFGIFTTLLAVGSSRSYFSFLLSRTLQGVFIGSAGIAKTVIVEITDSSNVANAFAFLPPVYPFGDTVGPFIGGMLAHTARRWPCTFGKLGFFREYPYFLSCAAASLPVLFAFLLAALRLKETLPSILVRRRHLDSTRPSSQGYPGYGSTRTDSRVADSERSLRQEVPILASITEPIQSSPPILSVLVQPFLLSLLMISFRAVAVESYRTLLPLMLSTSIPNGGLDFSSARIGAVLAMWGFCSGVFQLLCFARAIRMFGPKRTFQMTYTSYMGCFGLFPVMSHLATQAGDGGMKIIFTLVDQQIFATLASMAYGCLQLFIIDAIPEPAALATVHGVVHIVNSLLRAVAPALASSLFSISPELDLAGGYLVYALGVAWDLLGLYWSMLLPAHVGGMRK